MSFFKRKSRAKQAAEQEAKKAADEGPKPAPYKHVPKHAAADAAIRPTEKTGQAKIAAANQQRMSMAARDYALGTAADRQSIAHSAMHGTPSPSSLAGQQRQFKGTYGMQRNNSAEIFVTDPDAPPMPNTHMQQRASSTPRNGTLVQQTGSSIPGSGTPASTGGYFPQSINQGSSLDSPVWGNAKMQLAARDRGYVNPHHSGDSGYDSAAHSHTPNEQFTSTESNDPHLPMNNSDFLPGLSLSEELAREPAFSIHSFGGDEAPESSPRKAPESVLKGGKGYLERQTSQQDPNHDSRSVISTKSTKGPKQTRFEQAPENFGQEPQDQPARISSQGQAQQQRFQSHSEHDARPESATLPQPQYNLPMRTSTPPPATYDENRPSFAASVKHFTPQPQLFAEPQPQYTLPMRTSTPPPAREREEMSSPVRYSSPASQSNFIPLERIVSSGQQIMMNVPPVSKLEGFKVNKKGKILDEEGEPIGELCEGDIMDCVRQRVNAYGEVLDDYGSVVGRVRPLARSQESPNLRISSPTSLHPQYQYMPQYQQQDVSMSPVSSRGRRESAGQAEAFTPAWQQQHLHSPQPVLAQELQQHLATASQHSPVSVVRPIDFPNNVTAVELPAIEAEPQPEEETLPIFDHSDVYLPAPTVPARSPKRQETPSPPIEQQQQRPMSQQSAQRPTQLSHDLSTAQSKHISAPVPARQQYAPQKQEWAAAAAIERIEEQPIQGCALPPPHQPQAQQPASQPSMPRSTSSGGMTDQSKSYPRPSMSSVPEDSQLADEDRSPALFSYKGEIPATDGPLPNVKLVPPPALGANSPPPPNFPRQATGGGSTNLQALNSSQFSAAGANGARTLSAPRQFSTGVPGPRPMLNTRHSTNTPLKRSPLSSHEITPPDSDVASFEGDKIGLAHGMHSRQPSTTSVYTTASKPRTYFTHTGKVTVEAGQESPAQAAARAAAANTPAEPAKSATPSIAEGKKRRSRFSLSFGRKAVAAH